MTRWGGTEARRFASRFTASRSIASRSIASLQLLFSHAKIGQHRLHFGIVFFEILAELRAGDEIVGPEIALEILAPFRDLGGFREHAFPVGDLGGGETLRAHDGAPAAEHQVHSL